MMKYLIIGMLCLAACASKPAKSPQEMADDRVNSCNLVYEHLLTLQWQKVKGDTITNALQDKVALELLDNQARSNGASERFFNYCLNYSNDQQINCWTTAPDLAGAKLCDRMYRTPKKDNQ